MTEKAQEVVWLNDFDVLGVGGLRRKQLLALNSTFVLRCHPELIPSEQKEFYQAVLNETLGWLQPLRSQLVVLERPPAEVLNESLFKEFERAFPETHRLLQGSSANRFDVVTDYLRDFPWQGPLLSDHFRYLPSFLKSRKSDPLIVLTAQEEWLKSYLSFNDFGRARPEAGILRLNPSLQTLAVQKTLGLFQEGLFVYWAEQHSGEVRKHRLEKAEAEILDLLGEERKYSFQQVLSLVEETVLPEIELAKKLSNLISQGIILDN